MTDYLNTERDFGSDKLIEVFDELPLWSAPFGLKLLEGIRYYKGLQVVDIGCGTGFPLTEIAMRLGAGSRVYGLDPWQAAVERAEKKIDLFGIRNAEIIRGVAEKMPFGDCSTDLIVSNNGLNNVADIGAALAECSRIMKKEGQFIQTMNLEGSMSEFYSVMEQVFREMHLESCVESMNIHIRKKRKPLGEYLGLIESSGFIVKKVSHDTFYYRFTDGSAMLNHYFIRLAFLGSWKELVPADRVKEIFKIIEDRLNSISHSEGLLTLTIPFVVIDCSKA